VKVVFSLAKLNIALVSATPSHRWLLIGRCMLQITVIMTFSSSEQVTYCQLIYSLIIYGAAVLSLF